VTGSTPIRPLTADGLALEAAWDLPPAGPVGAVVLCHPHPLQGGTMRAPLIRALASHLAGAGHAVLRFNFRGVGTSEGSWGGGEAEIADVAAAVEAATAEYQGLPTGIVGWSFGAVTSLRWQARERSELPWVGIAPPMRLTRGGSLPEPGRLAPARRLFVLGDRDQFVTVPDLGGYAAAAGAEVMVLPGSDHFFYFRERRVADAAAAHLAGRSALVEAE
jgi:alpha/beta superfamily hydrolase